MQEKRYEKIRTEFDVILRDEDIDDIMVTALEGGINHWCSEVLPAGEQPGECAGGQISRGGYLKLHDFEGNAELILTKEKFTEGLKKYLVNPTAGDFLEFVDHRLLVDTGYVDAETADAIIQYALFGDVVYG